MNNTIIHVDMDAFFASVEVADNPKLGGKPVIVGGGSERGVVTTCSYEARKYGVHSAMPGFMAKKLCPNGIFLPVRMSRYKEVSGEVFRILYSITDLVEPLSIDEAFLDISHLNEDPIKIAKDIKQKVKEKTGLTISVGVSYNKFLAKLASDWNKPDGLKIINEDMVPHILLDLPVKDVYGIGKKSAKKLNNIGIYTVEDLMKLPKEFLIQFFGKYGIEIYDRIRGIDNRKINIERKIKSIGRETTLNKDTKDKEKLKLYLKKFSDNIGYSLNKRKKYCKTITIKIKTSTFEIRSKSKTIPNYINNSDDIYKISLEILKNMDLKENIRLIGLSVSNITDYVNQQLTFL